MQKVTNIKQLRESLLYNYDRLEKKNILPKEAKAFSDLAGKVMNTCKMELTYAKHHNKKRKINFLEP